MKKENRKLAQERRAKERRKKERRRKLKKALLIGIPILAVVILAAVIIFSAMSSSGDSESSEDQATEDTSSNDTGDTTDTGASYSTDTALTVEDGDTVNIDYVGTVDGEEFSGGNTNGAGTDLVIGSGSYIDDFEDQLIGKNIGDEVEVNVTFPEEYHAKELAGKPALFKVAVKGIKVKELPELDDEFAGEVSEFDTLDEYKKDIEAKILERKQKEAASENENRVVDKVVAGASMEIPDRMVEGQIDNMVQDTARRMESQGLNMDLYMKYTGMTMEQMREQMKPQALKRIQTRLVLEEVVKAENLQVSDERLDEEIAKMAAAYQMETDKLKGYMSDRDKDQMKEDIAVQEAVDFLVAEAKLV